MPAADSRVRVLGVDIRDDTMAEAIAVLTREVERFSGASRSVYFVNAHTLNVAAGKPSYRELLARGDFVFGDGTGVRWATRMLHSRRLRDNVNGTDFVPRFFAATAGRGYRYFLLGATPEVIDRAAAKAQELFQGWTLAGHHHGYLDSHSEAKVVEEINASGSQVLLVGMGNPLQEEFIERNLCRLRVPLCLGTGGLFTYWSGDLLRAPAWVRRAGCEWLYLAFAQPRRLGRYAVGNPLFLSRVLRSRREAMLVRAAAR